ncbi:hypothetical protein L484_022948 [Morus notabilis]|uniref:Uncharacterized protein n=1 Tax=Morus notabilis TaxID=981085 RepID=W9RFR1_9ROSA|nr:hypothetical protein L484_022948 [Morus notabilis]
MCSHQTPTARRIGRPCRESYQSRLAGDHPEALLRDLPPECLRRKNRRRHGKATVKQNFPQEWYEGTRNAFQTERPRPQQARRSQSTHLM